MRKKYIKSKFINRIKEPDRSGSRIGYWFVGLFLMMSTLVLAQPYIRTSSGMGQFGYIEKNTSQTNFHVGAGGYGNIYNYGVRSLINGSTNRYDYMNSSSPSGCSRGNESTSNLDLSSINTGSEIKSSVFVEYCGPVYSHGSMSPTSTCFNEKSFFVMDVIGKTDELVSTASYSSANSNVVLTFLIDNGNTAGQSLNRLWIKNNGTAQEGTDILNDSFALYYEEATGSEVFNGNESFEVLEGNHGGNSGTNEVFGHNSLGISIPQNATGGLRCYVVLRGTATYLNASAKGKTIRMQIQSDGMSFLPARSSQTKLKMNSLEPSGTDILIPVSTAPILAATTAASSIEGTTASTGGNVTDDGGEAVTERGVVYNTSTAPTTANSKVTASGTTGVFTSNLTGLTSGTTYYVRAYAINSEGTTYGAEINFTTDTAPTVGATTAASSIEGVTASSGGNITGDGNGTISERGIVFGTSSNPTTSDTKVVDGATTTGVFTSNLTGLTAGTTYYVRAYAINGVGTTYGTEISFTTDTVPTVTATTAVSSITGVSVTSGGFVTGEGNNTITERGIVYHTTTGPTVSNSKETASGTTGSFTSNLTGLTPGTTYYIRAYATNGVGTAYGPEVSFTTDTLPVLTTTAASSIAATLVTLGGNVTDDGGEVITERGVVYSTSTNPTTSDTKSMKSGTTGVFVSNITGLTHSTTYYVRAYAINSVGTNYGNEISFTTLTQTVPTLAATTAASSIEGATASSGGNVLGDGGDTITERGIVFGTSSNPTTSDTKVVDGATTTGSFTSNLTGLTAGTTYYVRAYAINGIGTGYGTEVSFTTDTAPTVAATTVASSIEGTTASSGGNVTGDGNGTISERGIVFGTSSNPTTSDTKVIDGATTTGSFTSNMTGLTPGTTYYVRAYAINGVDTTYGTEISFTTDTAPTVAATTVVSSIEGSTASSGGNITADGNGVILERGIVFGTSSNPTTSDTKVVDGATTTGSYTSSLTGLTAGTTYYVRAYAINGVGTTYGTEVSFTTDTAPTVAATTAVSSITASTASSGGNITGDGNGTISERGIVYGTSSNPTTSDTKVVDGATTTGTFTSNLTGLTEGTTYYVRAYAINGVGTTYGTEVSFTTLAVLPTIAATTAASSIEGTTASSGGNVTYDGNGVISERGIVYGTSSNPTTSDTKVVDGATTEGVFTSNITGLTANTTYYVRAYVINEIGTVYGTEVSFTTDTVPSVAATTAASSIEGSTASSGGNITADGNGVISERGIVFGTSSNPTTANTKVIDGATTTGTFTSNLTGLTHNTTYYVRAYAINGVGTTYGSEISFTTDDYPTVAATTAASSIEGTTASSGGNITADGNGVISERGIVFGTSSNPTTANTKVIDGAITTGSFTSNMTGLLPGTTYYVRAYAINGVGTAYGTEISFTTGVTPTVTTTDGGNTFDFESGNSGGNVTSTGGPTLIERGIVFGTSSNPTTANTKVIDGATTTGAYASSITGLSEATTYYVRAYAINDAGTSYGAEVSFTTLGKPNNLLANSNSPTTVDLSWDLWNGNDVMIVRHTANAFTQPTNTTVYSVSDAIGAGTVIYKGGATSVTDTGLSTATTYYYAFYSVNNNYYSDKDTTNEQTALPPTVTTDAASATSYYGGSATGDLVSDGGATVTERGFLIHTSTDPTYATATNILKSDDVTGTFTESLDGLLLYSRTYYIRAYAINAAGTSYGISRSITTSSKPSNDNFYADRIYFKNGSNADERYYLMYNNDMGCASSEADGTENWNTKNLGVLQQGSSAQLGAYTVTRGIQNANNPRLAYRIYERYASKPSFTSTSFGWQSNCSADGQSWNGTQDDKVWRKDLFDITIPTTPGEYAIEVYFWRDGDRAGSGGTKYINNGGHNFTAYITVESNDASDFPTGIISTAATTKVNLEANKYYKTSDVYYCNPGNEGDVAQTQIVQGTNTIQFGGEMLTTDAATSPVLYYTVYASGSRPNSPVFTALNLSLAGTQCNDVTNSYKYEAVTTGIMATVATSGTFDPGIHVVEFYYQATIGGTTYTNTYSNDDNYYTYFNVDPNDNVQDPNDGNYTPTCGSCSGIYESYMGLVIDNEDGSSFLDDIFDMDASNGSSNTTNFDLGDANPGVTFKIGTEAKVFTKGSHKACGCSSWFYTYKTTEPNPVATDFPLPGAGDLYESQVNGKFTIMNSSINVGWNQVYNTPAHTPSISTTTSHGAYSTQLETGATSTKFQDWTNSPLTINDPINEVACPTCEGNFLVAVAMLCWVSTSNDCNDESTLIYHRDINQNKVYDFGGTDVYLNPKHPDGPKPNKNTLTGTTLFYTSRIDIVGNGGPNTFNGTWSAGHISESSEDVTIAADYSTSAGSFTCNNLTIPDGVTLTIRDGEYVEVLNEAVTDGSGGSRGKIVVEKGGHFVQRCNQKASSAYIEHDHSTRTLAEYDYAYWGSPIVEDSFSQIPTTFDKKYYWQHGAGGGWNALSSTSPGVGFIARSTDESAKTLTFKGTANNGVIEVPIAKEDADVTNSNNYALLANPYASSIDATLFLQHSLNEHIGTIYLWTSNSRRSTDIDGANAENYSADDYASFNLTGATSATNAIEAGIGSSAAPDGNIYSGQGFFVHVLDDANAHFNNDMRKTTGNAKWLFKPGQNATAESTNEKSRLWLNITNSDKAFKQMLLGYVPGGTVGFDRLFDAPLNSVSDVQLYSIAAGRTMGTQARPANMIDSNETIPLGVVSIEEDTYTISIDHFDGKFVDKEIYLEDKDLNISHNLSESAYSFTTTSGTYDDRFQLRIANNQETLSTEKVEQESAKLIVVAQYPTISVTNSIKEISSVEVYNLLGSRLVVQEFEDASTSVTVSSAVSSNQVILVKVNYVDGTSETKKLFY